MSDCRNFTPQNKRYAELIIHKRKPYTNYEFTYETHLILSSSLPFKKCKQIQKLGEANKTFKNIYLIRIEFDIHGLITLEVGSVLMLMLD